MKTMIVFNNHFNLLVNQGLSWSIYVYQHETKSKFPFDFWAMKIEYQSLASVNTESQSSLIIAAIHLLQFNLPIIRICGLFNKLIGIWLLIFGLHSKDMTNLRSREVSYSCWQSDTASLIWEMSCHLYNCVMVLELFELGRYSCHLQRLWLLYRFCRVRFPDRSGSD